jgi:hypothetical protein
MSDEERLVFLREIDSKEPNRYQVSSVPKALPVAIINSAIKASGFAAYKMTVVVANGIAKAVLGRGLAFATNTALTKGLANWLSISTGPIGWAITGIWMLVDFAGPAYRVTVPCVAHIAMLRLKKKGTQSIFQRFCKWFIYLILAIALIALAVFFLSRRGDNDKPASEPLKPSIVAPEARVRGFFHSN